MDWLAPQSAGSTSHAPAKNSLIHFRQEALTLGLFTFASGFGISKANLYHAVRHFTFLGGIFRTSLANTGFFITSAIIPSF
jgi:hypothetical protein